MGNELSVFEQEAGLPANRQRVRNTLGGGIQGGYGVVGTKGKVWSLRYQGTEKKLLREDDGTPAGSIEVVIVKAADTLSKLYYKNGFKEGAKEKPTCFSNNALAPDPSAAEKQAATCALCPHNVWGSAVTPAGKATKACSDNKRIAVLPLADLHNQAFGGPLLLKIPAGSLKDLKAYGDLIGDRGFFSHQVATRISFDPNVAHQRFVFRGIRALSPEEQAVVDEWMNSPAVERVLAEDGGIEGETAQQIASQQATLQVGAPKANGNGIVAGAEPEMASPTVVSSSVSDFEKNLDAMMDGLLPPT